MSMDREKVEANIQRWMDYSEVSYQADLKVFLKSIEKNGVVAAICWESQNLVDTQYIMDFVTRVRAGEGSLLSSFREEIKLEFSLMLAQSKDGSNDFYNTVRERQRNTRAYLLKTEVPKLTGFNIVQFLALSTISEEPDD